MKTEYISIKEFAEIAGVSQQSIYKRLNKKDNPLQPYFKEVEGKKFLRRSALSLYEVEAAAGVEPEQSEVEQEEKAAAKPKEKKDSSERLLDLLEQQLQEKDRQLLEKDKQLQEKDKQLNSLLQRLEEANQIINQQQQLTAIDKKSLLEIDDKIKTEEVIKESEPVKKKSIFKIFDRFL